ncbi:hypothetical protein M413DRAFT_29722 [Hebeloma cylindrosporum]|uniref:Uncharacterized protein n=1 Tax=Hebeloma cylindrosporum TaxID=76867 RepID=A0A0C3BR99_HEBCY|nr:hypothetical protein M413DRAFT_29722 [Hebeloma cylindrosporum h7]
MPYLIIGLTPEQRDILLHWTTYLDNNDNAIAKIHIAIEEAILTDGENEFEGFLNNYLNLPQPNLTVETILNNVITSLLIIPLEITERGANVTLFNVYAPSPTLVCDVHTGWVNLFRERTYTFYGTANAMTPYTCGTCSGQDHPTGKCPLHKIPGWHKPETTTSPSGMRNEDKEDPPVEEPGTVLVVVVPLEAAKEDGAEAVPEDKGAATRYIHTPRTHPS